MAISEKSLVQALLRDQAKLFAFVRSMIHDRHLAEDIVQTVWLQASESRNEIKSEDHLYAWLRRVARHRVIDEISKRRDILTLDEDVLNQMESQWSLLDKADTTEMLEALRQCMKHLTPHSKRLIDLRYRDGISCKEIANLVGRSYEATKKALVRSRQVLSNCVRKALNGEGMSHV